MQLYTEQDFAATKKVLTVRVLGLAAIIAVMAAALAVFVSAARNEYAATASAIVGCCLGYMYTVTKLMPWYYYRQYQKDMKHGLSRETEAWFVSCSDSTRLSDGVAFHEFVVRIGDGEEDERLFLWDDDKQLPELKNGQKLRLRSFGNYITELHIEG